MNISNIINRDNQNYIVLSTAKGEIGMNLGYALAHADGSNETKNVIRTTKHLAEISNRTITEAEATEALAFVANAIPSELVERFNNEFSESKLVAIETEIVAALRA